VSRYPFWKGALLAGMLLAAILLALPNYYGKSPALQLSQRDRGAFDAAAATAIEAELGKAGIATESTYVDDDGRLWIRFDEVSGQLAARDLIQERHEGDYAIALTFASRAPEWLGKLGIEPMNLGLDLRGGMHLVYEVDVEGAVGQLLQRMERDFRKELRDARIPYEEVVVAGTTTRIQLRDPAQTEAARKVLLDYDPLLTLVDGAAPGALVA
jgi:preprotein translocase subunit SecD